MAKKIRVKYAYGTPEAYNKLAVKDEFTVYFIIDSEGFGTLYKGADCLGSVDVAKLCFTKTATIVNSDTSYSIEKGTSVFDAFKQVYNDMILAVGRTQDDILGYVEENYATPTNVDDAIYTFKTGHLTDNYYNKVQSDDRYVAASELDNIRNLAAIFSDEEKMAQLLAAAEGIEAVMSNYYSKDYIDSSVDNVLTFDSSVDFPSTGEVNKLYVDDNGNTMYRWAREFDGLPDRTYVPISGVGGGGTGGSDVKVESAIYIKGNKTNDTVAKGSPYVLQYAYTSANTFTSYNKEEGQFEKVVQQTGKNGTVKYFIDGVQFASGSAQQANYNEDDDSKNIYNRFTIPAARFTGSEHTIKIQITDIAGNVATEEVTISIVSITIKSSYTANPISLAKEIEIPVTVAASGSASVYYQVDNGDQVLGATIATGAGNAILVVSPLVDGVSREHGVHNIKVWATTYIAESDTTLSTNVLEFNTIWYDVNNLSPIIASSIDLDAEDDGSYYTTQYEFVTLSYQVYPACEIELHCKDNATNVDTLINTLSVNTAARKWSYTFDKEGSYTLYIKANYGNHTPVYSSMYTIEVAKAAYSLEAEPGADMFFTAKNRSNDEASDTRSVWNAEIGNYTAELRDFAWNDNSGWYVNANTTALRVAGGARCVIPYAPFDNDYRTNGQVIEFDFSTTNLSDSTTTVVSCFSETDNSGIVINANTAYFTSTEFSLSDAADNRIKVPFKENERVRISFVITPLNADDAGAGVHDVTIWDSNEGKYVTKESVSEGWWRFVKVYVNGVCTAVNLYSKNASFKQTTPSYITIGSDKATIDLYSIRSYKKALYDKALVNNYVADTQDPNERLRLYLRNNILKTSGTDIDYSKLLKKMPCFFVTCESDVTSLEYGYANAEHILPMNKKDKRGYTVIFNCEQLDEDAKRYYNFCHSFIAYNAQLTVQGTSSQYYPRKNYKLKIKPEKKWLDGAPSATLAAYNAVLNTKKPTLLFIDTVGTNDGSKGTGATEEGKLNRLNEAETFKDKYAKKYTLKDFGLAGTAYSSTATITSIPATEFCLKADFAEASGTHNTGMAKYVDFILKNLGYNYLTPPQKAEYNLNNMNINKVSTRTTVDGYPTAIFWRRTYNDEYEFLGKYNFNFDKGAEDIYGFVGDIVESNTTINPMTAFPFSIFDEDYYDAASRDDRFSYDSPVECWEFTNNSENISKFKDVTDDTFRVTSEEYGMAWLGSFEARHPDNDTQASDYAEGKDPIHWRKFMTWVSSTDRDGYHDVDKTLKIPVAWNDTLDALSAGSSTAETFEIYHGTLEQMNNDTVTEFNRAVGYILEPQVVIDPGTGEVGPDDSYILFGHIARYNNETHLWYDDGKYEVSEGAVSTSKWYYIAKTGDANYNKVYKYTNDWTLVGTLQDLYALATPAVYKSVTYRYDTAEYRLAKFANELQYHMNVDSTTAYYILTEFFGCVDQRAKNMMFASWGYENTSGSFKPANAFADEAAAEAAGYKGVFKYSIDNTLSAPNPYVGEILLGTSAAITPGAVVLNEFCPATKDVELYNTTAEDVDLSGCVLKRTDETGTEDDETKWAVIPDGTVISAHGYLVIGGKESTREISGGFGMSATKWWTFKLYQDSTVIDEASNGTSADNIIDLGGKNSTKSLGRSVDGASDFIVFDVPTLGSMNTALTHSVIINEVCVADSNTKYIELYNPGATAVSIDGWTLYKGDTFAYSDTAGDVVDVDSDKSVTFSGVEIPANGFYAVNCIKKSTTPNVLPAGISGSKGFCVKLVDNNGNLVDLIDNGAKFADGTDKSFVAFAASAGRYPDGEGVFVEMPSTVGEANAAPAVEIPITEITSHLYFDTNVEEFSGICFNSDKSGFYAVSDKGFVYSLTMNGVATNLNIASLADKDLEGITMDPDGNLYTIVENTGEIYKISPDTSSATLVGTAVISGQADPTTYGFEGIAAIGNNMFFVGNQQQPAAVYRVDATAGTTTLFTNIECATEIADLFYDGSNLWVMDSNECTLCKIAGENGNLTTKYSFPFISTAENPEAIAVDKASDIAYIGCDNSTTRRLYKASLTNASLEPVDVDPGTPITDHVVLNEFDGANKKIELYNPTNAAVNIGGWWLVKTPQDFSFNDELAEGGDGSRDTWQIPVGASIPSHGYYIITCGQVPGSPESDGPSFGLSFKSIDKKFDMYLMTDAANLKDAIGAQTIDESKVVDHADNYTNPVVIANNVGTWGRVKDGYSNFCIFAAPGTINSSNDNGTPIGGGSDIPETSTTKTPLYWVPADAEYIYYPIFYDNDTILSLNNTGYIKYDPNVESTDRVGSGYAYNGTESVLWINFKDAFADKIAELYALMRSNGGLDYANAIHYFNETQSDLWPEVMYNLDAKFKYIDPATIGYIDFSQRDNDGNIGITVQEGGYLYECQGSRAEHRKWWLNNRFIYMDSRYNTGSTYKDAYATMRLYTPKPYPTPMPDNEFTLTPYTDMYLRIRYGSIDSYVRAEKNKPYSLSVPGAEFNNTETIIYGAPYILSFGDLKTKYADSIAIGNATKITDLLLGGENYTNENLTNLTVAATNTGLRNIDVRGCTKLSVLNGLGQINAIESVKATNTSISNIEFSTTGANLRTVAYPASISVVKLVNMNYITNSGMSFVSYKNLATLWIENCPNVDTWSLIQNILNTSNNVLANVRLTGINWSIQTTAEFELWKQILKKGGIADDTTYSLDIPYLTGTVTIGPNITVSTGYKAGIEAMFRNIGCDLTVNVSSTEGLTGVNIEGPSVIVPNIVYTYKAAYLPDDFVLPSDRGVSWTVNSNLTIVSQDENELKIKYVGSTAGTNYYKITATSLVNSAYSTELSIRPSATLNSIRIYDSVGNEIDYTNGVEMYEGEIATFTVKFDPEDTEDTELDFNVTNAEYLVNFGNKPYEYSTNTNTLTVKAAEVSGTRNISIQVSSHNLPSISRSIILRVNNIVSRVIYLQDDTNGTHTRIAGYAEVVVDGDPNVYRVYTADSLPGVITLPTNKYDPANGCFGFKKLSVKVEATDKDTLFYNSPETITMSELPETVVNDDVYTVSFYTPVAASITVLNSGKPVTDRRLKIYSLQNDTIRNLKNPPYNNVIIAGDEDAGPSTVTNPVNINLLAATSHEIEIVEVDNVGVPVVGGRYSRYNGTIITGVPTTDGSRTNYTISISRDYLGDYNTYDATELRMTVVTGSRIEYLTLRLYYTSYGEVDINWGDGTTTTLANTNGVETTIYHQYPSVSTEYDISVTENTNYIKWLFINSESSTANNASQVCFGNQNAGSGFRTEINADNAGIVAYESIGNASITTPMIFSIAAAANKQYSKLISVGNIYKKCTTATSANRLFANTTLEQIPSSPMFAECAEVKSFNSTFENTNITSLPANFFIANTKATSYNRTFYKCSLLSNISTTENISYFALDEGIEMTSLSEMFADCPALTSAVPSFWKTFYGCSFCDINVRKANAQNTFARSTNIYNFDIIPPSWGGIDDAEHSEYKDTTKVTELEYIKLGSAGLGYFELTDIYPDPSWKYVLTMAPVGTQWYEPGPLFGSAYGIDPTDVNSIAEAGGYLYDFYFAGVTDEDGKIGEDSGGIWGGNVPYHAGTIDASIIAGVIPGGYGTNTNLTDETMTIDVGYSRTNYLSISQSGQNLYKLLPSWPDNLTDGCNFPLRVMFAYGISAGNPAVDNFALNYLYEGVNAKYNAQSNKLKEFVIYNENKQMIHDLIPAYGVQDDYLSVMLYDRVTDKSYPVTMGAAGYAGVTFYKK